MRNGKPRLLQHGPDRRAAGVLSQHFFPPRCRWVPKWIAGRSCIETLEVLYSGDGVENVREAVLAMRQRSPDMILCTGGMSVDPDDNTPGCIKAAGADIVCYGAPVLPGAMFLLGYFEDGLPVMGLPGCVMYAGATIFDLILPKVAADIPVTRSDIAALGEGGLCLGCKECHYPICPFGK